MAARYLAAGGDGLYDLSRARYQVVNRTPMHIERTILAIRNVSTLVRQLVQEFSVEAHG